MVVPSQCTSQMEDAYDQQCADDNAYGCSMHLPAYEAMLAAAPAPVERLADSLETVIEPRSVLAAAKRFGLFPLLVWLLWSHQTPRPPLAGLVPDLLAVLPIGQFPPARLQ